MNESSYHLVKAEVTLLPREDGRPQTPPRLFTGYRCSSFRFDDPRPEWPARHFGLASMRLLDRDTAPVGELVEVVMEVVMEVGLDAALADGLRPGARFSLYEIGRRVVSGTILALVESKDAASDARTPG